jgi:hypothetical protein
MLEIRTVPQGGAALVIHKLTPPGGEPDAFAFLVRLARPEWAGKSPAEVLDALEAVLLEGIQMRRDALGIV